MVYEQPRSPGMEDELLRAPSCSSGFQKYRTALSYSDTSLASYRDLPVVSLPSSCCMSNRERSVSYCSVCGRRDLPPAGAAAPPLNLNVNIYMNSSKAENEHLKVTVANAAKTTYENKATQYDEMHELTTQCVMTDSSLASAISASIMSELLRGGSQPEYARSASAPITFEEVESVGDEFILRPEAITGLKKPSKASRAGVTGKKNLRWQFLVSSHEITTEPDGFEDVGVQVDARSSSSQRNQVAGSLCEVSQAYITTPVDQIVYASQTTPAVPPRRRLLRQRSPKQQLIVQPTEPDLFNVMSTTPPDDSGVFLGLVEDGYRAFSDH